MKRNKDTDPAKKKRVGLLTSMLLIFLSALVVSISLTILLFSLLGRKVYTGVMANALRPQARMLAGMTYNLLQGTVSENDYRFMLRSSEATVVALDKNGAPIAISESGRDENMPDRPGDEPRPPIEGEPGGEPNWPMGGDPGQMPGEKDLDRYMRYCSEHYGDAASAAVYSEYVASDADLGVIVALPVTDESTGDTLGVLYMIKAVYDIDDTAKSIQIVLIIAALIVAVIMVIPIYLVTRWLTDPLRKLNTAANEFSSGDYSLRVEAEGCKEMSELGNTFNKLADNLQLNIGELVFERNRLHAVLNGLSEGLVAFDTDGAMTRSNNSAMTLLGGREGDSIETLPAFDEVRGAAIRAMENDEPCGVSVTSGERIVRVSAAPIEEENGRVAGAVALLLDITEPERLEQTRRDYVANVSHELRTPLASIRGIADMLCDGLVKDESDKQRYYGYIQRESIRLSTLINDLLELSRLQSGGVALKMRKLELYELMADVADRMTEPAHSRGMELELLVPEGRYYACSNPDRVEQVLISLVDNAVKHGREGGTVSIGLGENGDKWLIYVENPADINERDLDHLFERFYKADTAHTGEGTGLGLAITEEVLRLMGETIEVSYDADVIRFTFTASKKKD